MADAFIYEGVRSPLGKRDGAFAGLRPDDLLADVLKGLVKKTGIESHEIEDVI